MTQPAAIPILIYHSLSSQASAPYKPFSMDPGQFTEQMEHIAAGGYTALTVGQLLAAIAGSSVPPPERPIVITFDDGFEDLHSVALPVLTRLGLRATAYIVTAYLGGTSRWLAPLGEGDRPMLSTRQVRDLDEAGVEIGAHGHRHLALDEMPLSVAESEIDTSRICLEEIVDHEVVTFAYPFGYHTQSIKRYLAASGFESACGVKQALSYRGDDQFALARAIVGSDLSTAGLDAWLRGEDLPLGWQTERPQTKAWRTVRRVRRVISRARSERDG